MNNMHDERLMTEFWRSAASTFRVKELYAQVDTEVIWEWNFDCCKEYGQ
jgi:hypothetical protein